MSASTLTLDCQTQLVLEAYICYEAQKLELLDKLAPYIEPPLLPENFKNGPQIISTIETLVESFERTLSDQSESMDLAVDFGIGDNFDKSRLITCYSCLLARVLCKTNWGRIVGILDMFKKICISLIESERTEVVPDIVLHTRRFFINQCSPFLKSNHGWSGLISFQNGLSSGGKLKNSPENRYLQAFFKTFAGFVGMGLLIKVVTSKF
ncbi:hypothetical protein Ciccas_006826 [Cichlidogyrus casuarinus]|uniref:Bcl-2 Bcl-2 homology region 1-3 domain-containing protein n=1 Tax=Cichlidogyrus casuarinus TaxID=1844966 RepID=A0ABD2Q560_9PLAT